MKSLPFIIIGIIIIGAIAYIVLLSPESSEKQTLEATPVSVGAASQGGFVQEVPEGLEMSEELLSQEEAANGGEDIIREVVSIDDEGFSPATLTVAAGTTIVFTNNGQGLHWVASDPHPTHTNVPGLDSKKGLATGESFSFTFTKPGTYTMHDHLAATYKATIIVQ